MEFLSLGFHHQRIKGKKENAFLRNASHNWTFFRFKWFQVQKRFWIELKHQWMEYEIKSFKRYWSKWWMSLVKPFGIIPTYGGESAIYFIFFITIIFCACNKWFRVLVCQIWSINFEYFMWQYHPNITISANSLFIYSIFLAPNIFWKLINVIRPIFSLLRPILN